MLDLTITGTSLSKLGSHQGASQQLQPSTEDIDDDVSLDIAELELGESGLVLPKELFILYEYTKVHASLNAMLRDLHKEAEELAKKNEKNWDEDDRRKDKEITKKAEEVVKGIEDITTKMTDFPDLLYDLHDAYLEHESIQAQIEEAEQKHIELFDGIEDHDDIPPNIKQEEEMLIDQLEELEARFTQSYERLSQCLKDYNNAVQ